ncbi:G-protein coupled receptor moody-like [Ostrea edulis]|uniref:G-protein coupled receptor moody-like n=1 Tax=Ostrea edulis TaxID=37623 RepID=UPI0024AF5882|nr:G-protein coupled receptor moody-like [Ostrea edulis]
MTANSTIDNEVLEDELSWNRTLHQTLSLSISVVGTLLNVLATSVIVKGGLYKQSSFKFVLNLFLSNFFLCAMCLPIVFYTTLSPNFGSSGLCPVFGYIIYCVLGTKMLSIVLISLNRYFLIVKYTLYPKVYTARNIRLMFVVNWTFYPFVLAFPLSEIWGTFAYEKHRFICNPLHSSWDYRVFIIITTFVITVPAIIFSYVGILRVVNSNFRRVNTLQKVKAQRLKNDKQLVRTILATIILYTTMNVPFLVLSIADPHTESVNIIVYDVAIYLGWSNALMNPLIYSALNNQIKSSFMSVWEQICKKKPQWHSPWITTDIEIRVISAPNHE